MLGIPRNADTEQVRRVYKKKIAENKGNEAAIRRIEEAHTALMMSSFSARLSVSITHFMENAWAAAQQLILLVLLCLLVLTEAMNGLVHVTA